MVLAGLFRYHSAFGISPSLKVFFTSPSMKDSIDSKLLIFVLITLMMVTISGCRKDKNVVDLHEASEMYSETKEYLSARNWGRAIQAYQGLTTRFPFGRYAEQAQLDLAYAYYKGGRPEAYSTSTTFRGELAEILA